jgi:hypothetical protein
MGSVLTIIKGDDIIARVREQGEIPCVLADAGPGRFVIEESSMAGELLPSGYSCQRWGTAIRHADGSVTLDADPWDRNRSPGEPRRARTSPAARAR